jgi:hypothetical protein
MHIFVSLHILVYILLRHCRTSVVYYNSCRILPRISFINNTGPIEKSTNRHCNIDILVLSKTGVGGVKLDT